MSRILACSEPWYIQNPGKLGSRAIFSTLVYQVSEGYSYHFQVSAIERFTKTMRISFLYFFPIWQIPTLERPPVKRSNEGSIF